MTSMHALICAALTSACTAGPDPNPWARHLGAGEAERANAFAAQGQSLFLAGITASTDPFLDAWVVKMTAAGGVIWGAALGGDAIDEAYDVTPTPDGGCIVAGSTYSFGAGDSDGWIIRLDGAGAVVWQKTYGGPECDSFKAIAPSPRGYYVGGHTGCNPNAWMLEIDADGAVIWQRTYPGEGVDEITSITPTETGVAFIANSNSDFDKVENIPFFRPWLANLDADGNVLWSRTYNVSGGDAWNDIKTTDDGGFIVAGEVLAAAFFRGDVWIVKLNETGDVIWDQRIGDNFDIFWYDAAFAVLPAPDGGYLALGSTGTAGAGSDDLWLVKVDDNGAYQWDRTYGSVGFDNGFAATVADDGRLILAGLTQVLPAPAPVDALVLATTPEGLLQANCDLIGKGQPNIWTDALPITNATVTPITTNAIALDSTASTVPFGPFNTLCAPTLHQQKR